MAVGYDGGGEAAAVVVPVSFLVRSSVSDLLILRPLILGTNPEAEDIGTNPLGAGTVAVNEVKVDVEPSEEVIVEVTVSVVVTISKIR